MAERVTQEPGGPTAQGPRLLPWATEGGHPCYLSTDGQGYLANLADNIEAIQLGMGEDLLGTPETPRLLTRRPCRRPNPAG
ncbi:hypothetical protein RM572_18185 [Streptomyces sp. DSM 42041]|uniref:Uncharacterized protein n=1 Tax=Streptomyces hazeniae TaxID=3075538 RepID=A0ABU2NUN7_9ACTN|nr:hypothetical protein [Streptomyces sp. DSM 42041]MDT0380685.1 hypothetical protein [Streptomyces sp. DSM 42041]